MGVSIIRGEDYAAFYDNTGMVAFGPVFPSVGEAVEFREFLSTDARELHHRGDLEAVYREWRQE